MITREKLFEEEYKKLNPAQREAVDSIEGPVMVVAGPGTGKTQILALRIGNILNKTDTKADGVLCLTFTNSAVRAMRERLRRYIGDEGDKVNVFTFHSFGLEIIGKYFKVLGLPEMPKLLDEGESAVFFDEILESGDWEYLRPRGDRARYFGDLKSLSSLLGRERIGSEDFAAAIDRAIKDITQGEENLSTRGSSKGELKKEALKEIEGLEKSREVARFLEVYERKKSEKNMLDYDDVLEYLVRIMEKSEEALAHIREQYLYVLVDEHQDSSRVQNEFLARVWGGLEKPNVFVVGDDRQLIYGFAGASIDHFAGFQKTFPEAKLIPLLYSYRSTQVILDAAHTLLPSVISSEKLLSVSKETHPIRLLEAENPRQEIRAAGEAIKNKIKEGLKPDDCALLVPKNAQARAALEILHRLEIPLALEEALNLFDQKEAQAFLRILKILAEGDPPSLALSFFDEFSGVPPLAAHTFFANRNTRDFSFKALLSEPAQLFGAGPAEAWIQTLSRWHKNSREDDVKTVIETIGRDLSAREEAGKKLVPVAEVAATLLALLEKHPAASLAEFVLYLEKVAEYGDPVSLVTGRKDGVRVLTMHAAKGLEFDFVWIAHIDEGSLAGGRRFGFVLPQSILEKIEERDIDAVKRKLFVAITRAKHFCTLSYALSSNKGREQALAEIIADLPGEVFERGKVHIEPEKKTAVPDLAGVNQLAREKYSARYISASLLNNFFECPWKWYFRNILQIPEPENENMTFGSLVHAAIDQIIKSGKIILPEDKKAAKVVQAWAGKRLAALAPDRRSEQSVSVADKNFPHLSMYGRIDLIEKLGGGVLRVTDFKTGSPRKKSEIEKPDPEGRMSGNLRQLAMYSYLIKQSPQWQAEVGESRLEFVEAKNPKENFYDTVIGTAQLDLIIK
jgi:DNA helicase-2/ATP-dependent DNA helicase PcrA